MGYLLWQQQYQARIHPASGCAAERQQ